MTVTAEHVGDAADAQSEIAGLVNRWDIGAVAAVRALDRGAGRSRKAIVDTRSGRFVLKMRPVEPKMTERVLRAHAVQRSLASAGFPLAVPMPDESGRTLVATELGLCELMPFVEGHSPRGNLGEVREAGAGLARLHALLRDTPQAGGAPAITFHNRRDVLATCDALAADASLDLAHDMPAIRSLYERAASAVATAGWERWPVQPVHGDWHPGNLLFAESHTPILAAALDFDGIRTAPRIDDLASAAVQFALRQDREAPEGVIDAEHLAAFAEGYRSADTQEFVADAARCMPWAMAEAVIAEAIGRIVRRGGEPTLAKTLVGLARAAAEQLTNESDRIAAHFTEG